jgi:hypothetical protein
MCLAGLKIEGSGHSATVQPPIELPGPFSCSRRIFPADSTSLLQNLRPFAAGVGFIETFDLPKGFLGGVGDFRNYPQRGNGNALRKCPKPTQRPPGKVEDLRGSYPCGAKRPKIL